MWLGHFTCALSHHFRWFSESNQLFHHEFHLSRHWEWTKLSACVSIAFPCLLTPHHSLSCHNFLFSTVSTLMAIGVTVSPPLTRKNLPGLLKRLFYPDSCLESRGWSLSPVWRNLDPKWPAFDQQLVIESHVRVYVCVDLCITLDELLLNCI